ncbi:hypothetical protein TNCV_1352211 [Trichonephila clavipes]|nr:hypothetical protein TNCV_1352211 [Trichonephila clavipes]
MDNYKITIEFFVNELSSIPETCNGKSFSFHGDLDEVGDVTINGNNFCMKIVKDFSEDELIYNSFEMDGQSLEMQLENLSQTDIIEHPMDKENLNVAENPMDKENLNVAENPMDKENLNVAENPMDKENLNVAENPMDKENLNVAENPMDKENLNVADKTMQDENEMEVKHMKIVPGVICMSFIDGEPYEYTISSTTHYVHQKCYKNWFENLEENVKLLEISHLYAIGRNQQIKLQNYIRNIPIYLWTKPNYFPPKCPNCLRHGCSQYKTKFVLYDMFKYVFELQCEHE